MGTSHRRRSIVLRVLLVVLATQGITPDARDISSRWLLQQFARSVIFVAPPADANANEGAGAEFVVDRGATSRSGTGEKPARGEDRERTPDEVCTAPLSDHDRSRHKVPARPVLGIAAAPRLGPWFDAAPARPPRPFVPRAGLIHTVCRLTC